MKCKDCKHWGNSGGYGRTIFAGRLIRDCERINRSDLVETSGEPFGDQGTIGTAPEFGCVLFEPKDGVER